MSKTWWGEIWGLSGVHLISIAAKAEPQCRFMSLGLYYIMHSWYRYILMAMDLIYAAMLTVRKIVTDFQCSKANGRLWVTFFVSTASRHNHVRKHCYSHVYPVQGLLSYNLSSDIQRKRSWALIRKGFGCWILLPEQYKFKGPIDFRFNGLHSRSQHCVVREGFGSSGVLMSVSGVLRHKKRSYILFVLCLARFH